MKKIILVMALVIASMLHSYAQNRDVKLFELEVAVGITTAGEGSSHWIYSKRDNRDGPFFLIEPRFNIPNSSFDLSAQLSNGFFEGKKGSAEYDLSNFTTIAAYSNYNFKEWKHATLFAGCGLGYGSYKMKKEFIPSGYKSSLFFAPRVGIEFLNHLRLTLDYKLMQHKHLSNLNITLGIVFGGGKK
ncbi:MAG: outer membrane beta-barrel protein [Bacteroidales bacterium]